MCSLSFKLRDSLVNFGIGQGPQTRNSLLKWGKPYHDLLKIDRTSTNSAAPLTSHCNLLDLGVIFGQSLRRGPNLLDYGDCTYFENQNQQGENCQLSFFVKDQVNFQISLFYKMNCLIFQHHSQLYQFHPFNCVIFRVKTSKINIFLPQ